jgi:peptide-methionine (S)-S-oxide reductase
MNQQAIFAAGCFWGVEEIFRTTKGVVQTEVGYIGGTTDNPTYAEVCYKNTGHAEAVRVTFDPNMISFDELMNVFWKLHDPTQVNRQGPDVGDQYRSAVFVLTPEQEAVARKSKAELEASGKYSKPIATLIIPAGTFYLAEEFHQKYLMKRGEHTCAV